MIPAIIAYKKTTIVAVLRFQPNLSISDATIASIIDTDDVIAAKSTITKKTIPTTVPTAPIALNTFGNEINISPGPADIPSLPINTNTAGTIIRPASKATRVSKISI